MNDCSSKDSGTATISLDYFLSAFSRPSAITKYRARLVTTLRQPCSSFDATNATDPGPRVMTHLYEFSIRSLASTELQPQSHMGGAQPKQMKMRPRRPGKS